VVGTIARHSCSDECAGKRDTHGKLQLDICEMEVRSEEKHGARNHTGVIAEE
jgi:hypothetical protein